MTGSAVLHGLTQAAADAAGAIAAVQLLPALLGVPGVSGRLPGLTGPHRPGCIGLTFDDGPHPDGTPAVLDQLDRFGVTATFFVVGKQLERRPGLGRRIAEQGHQLAVHGWDHRPLPCRRPGRIAHELARTRDLIIAVAGVSPRWYRPPYGVPTGEALWAARRLGLRPIWWHRWGRDWYQRATPTGIARAAIGPPGRPRLHGGQVILLHDSDAYAASGSWRSTAAALPIILEYAACRGVRVRSLEVGMPDGGQPPAAPTFSAGW